MVDPSPFINALIGKTVSHVWRGYGSALFIEFGQLTPRKRRSDEDGNPNGEITLMVEWSWRFERKYSILGGSWSSEGKWPGMFKKLLGASVTDVQVFGHLPEISISFSNGLRVVSFMTAEGQPAWALLTRNPSIGHLSVKRGRLSIDTPNS
ncbi:MAG: hypothetical protein PHE17_03655 [Thiothrix sp.]|uniref:hypothetical protein n=1 Tax=Thiothrix sp. TaxID=1032 RepID=UPI00262F845C|nr:hypothetical protein [Thiothrix sp.]MDD5392097.1 hypothetical protein [Thiothrix sp.]